MTTHTIVTAGVVHRGHNGGRITVSPYDYGVELNVFPGGILLLSDAEVAALLFALEHAVETRGLRELRELQKQAQS